MRAHRHAARGREETCAVVTRFEKLAAYYLAPAQIGMIRTSPPTRTPRMTPDATPSPTLPVALRTPRLLLRRWRPDDAPLMKAAVDASLAHLQASVEWARHEPTPVAQLAERLAGFAAGFNAGGEWLYGILPPEESRVLGGCGAELAEPALTALVGPSAVEVGYWLRADATGHGYATEATAALMDAAFTHLGARRVVVCHDPANVASGAVPRRLGFRCLGIVSSAELPGRRAADGSVRAATTVWVRDADPARSVPRQAP